MAAAACGPFCLELLRLRVLLLLAPLPINDFLVYWASGRLFLTGANPYSVPAIFAIERSIGWPFTHPMSLLYPPWSFPFVALFGVFSFHTAQYAWLAVSLALEAISAVALWRYFGGEKSKQWIALVLFATFLPIGSAEQMGQITPLILAGLTAFLFLLRRQRYLLAGACLLTLGLKPHLIYLVLLALLLWTIQTRRWSLALSAIFFYASSTIAAIAFNRNVLDCFHGTVHDAVDISCGVGGALRSIFGMQHTWLQFLPTAIGTAWFAHYWIRNRRGWTWKSISRCFCWFLSARPPIPGPTTTSWRCRPSSLSPLPSHAHAPTGSSHRAFILWCSTSSPMWLDCPPMRPGCSLRSGWQPPACSGWSSI